MKSEYEKYIVAHIDVLGTKDILKNCKSSNEFLLKLRDIYSAARSEIGNFNKSVQNEFDQQKDGFECKDFNVKTKIFSDNICIYLTTILSFYFLWHSIAAQDRTVYFDILYNQFLLALAKEWLLYPLSN